LILPTGRGEERTMNYCGVTATTVRQIRWDTRNRNEESPLCTRGKKRPWKYEQNIIADDCYLCVVNITVTDFYVEKKVVPACNKLLPITREKINFPWNEQSLRRYTTKIGFRWRKCQSKRIISVERPSIVEWHYRYLVKLNELWSEGRSIFYIDEMWTDSNLTFKKCSQTDEVTGVLADGNVKKRVIGFHADSENGFVTCAQLMYKAESVVSD
jgi:hypothetical protein